MYSFERANCGGKPTIIENDNKKSGNEMKYCADYRLWPGGKELLKLAFVSITILGIHGTYH